MAAPEGLADQLGDIRVGHIVQGNIFHALLGQTAGQDVSCILRVTVNRAAEDRHAPVLRSIGAPLLVLVDKPANILPPDGTMKRTDVRNIQAGRLFQQRLYLGAVFAHDVGIIPPGIIQPVPLKVHLVGIQVAVQRAEGTESVGREQNPIGGIVGCHGLGPVDHGRHDKGERVPSGGQGIPLFHRHSAAGQVQIKELADHGDGLGVAHHLGLGIPAQDLSQGGAVVRLHVVHYHIVQVPSMQTVFQVFQETVPHRFVRCIQQNGLFVQHQIGVIGDSPGNRIHILK